MTALLLIAAALALGLALLALMMLPLIIEAAFHLAPYLIVIALFLWAIGVI